MLLPSYACPLTRGDLGCSERAQLQRKIRELTVQQKEHELKLNGLRAALKVERTLSRPSAQLAFDNSIVASAQADKRCMRA